MSTDDRRDEAARVLYRSGLFSYREISSLLGISYRKAYAAVNGPEGEKTRPFKARLTWEQVTQIRKLYKEGGLTQQQLAIRFRTHQTNISMIVRGKSRKKPPKRE